MTKAAELELLLTDIYNYLLNSYKNSSIVPSVRDIGRKFGIKSTSSVNYYLKKLEERGAIKIHAGISRGIELADKASIIPEGFLEIPLLGSIAAGRPKMVFENYIDTYIVPKSIINTKSVKDLFMLKVEGTSMIDVGMHEDDLIIVKKQPTAENGQIIAALVDGDQATVKRYYNDSRGVRLHPENRNMQDIYPTDLFILGTVVGLIRTNIQ